MRPRILTAVVTAAVFLLASCSTPGVAGTTKPGDNVLIVSTPTPPDSLDPTLANTFAARLVFTSFCEKLYDVDTNLKIVPELAAALPTMSDGGKVMEITLRGGIRFNDGTPLTAAAVKTTLDRDITMSGSARAVELNAVARVEVTGPLTIRLVLKHPDAPLLSQLADRSGLIMSPTRLKKLGANFGTDPICVGPFTYKGQVSGNEMDFVRSNYYYDRNKVRLNGIIYKFITDSSVATTNLEAGDVAAAEHLDPSDAIHLRSEPGFTVLQSNTIAYQSLEINIRPNAGTPLSKSASLREALEMSIDRNALNQAVWNGQQNPGCGPLPLQSAMYRPLACTPFDPAKARELVRRSGFRTPVPVQLMVPTGTSEVREAQVVQAMADDVGFSVSVRPIDLVSGLVLASKGQFDVFLEGWSGRVDPDGDTNGILTTGGPNNYSGYHNKNVDSLVARAAATNDTAKRARLYAEAVAQVARDRPLIYLYHDRWFTATSSKVHGVVYGADGIPRFKTAYISK